MFRPSRSAAYLLSVVMIFSSMSPGPLASTKERRSPDTITGTLVGKVVNETGGPLAAVRIIVINQETGSQRATKTGEDGWYSLPYLPLGIYTIEAYKDGYKVIKPTAQPVKTALNKTINTAPEIIMAPDMQAAATTPGTQPQPATTTPQPPAAPPQANTQRDEVGSLANTNDATRRSNADERQIATLLLSGIRSFDDFAMLAAGVAPPPEVKGVAGPGIGSGIGTPGQFAVNGQRARSNNFTVDGSDNNDEDVGVRRQGFVSLVPQSIESIREFQIVTQLWDAEMGRNVGSQVNAVSKSGSNKFHGSLYDFFSHDSLNARNFFDYTSDKAASYALTARAPLGNSFVTVPVKVDGRAVVNANPSENENPFQRNQGGVALGFPLRRDKTFFFGSFERQDTKARQETHFAVPTVEQRGFLGFGATGFNTRDRNNNQQIFFPTFIAGDAAFSLYPFPNNPIGPYRESTFTQVLPADAKGTLFSLKFDHELNLLGQSVLTGRYNFTEDEKQVPAVGSALFSGLKPDVRTQNLSLFLNSQWTTSLANQLRGSYGRTNLGFNAVRNPLTIASEFFPNDPFLINRRGLFNTSLPSGNPADFASYTSSTRGVEGALGPIGQLNILPFSPVGLDVFLFPQGRTNNTFQVADTVTFFRGRHYVKFGADIRRTQLNSFLNRNFRPQVTFGGTVDLTGSITGAPLPNLSGGGPTPGLFTGTDLASLGIPTGIFQSLATGVSDSTIGLRFWQQNFFMTDNWRARNGLTLDFGMRYEYNSTPREANGRIERTFQFDQLLPQADPNVSVGIPFTSGRAQFDRASTINAFNVTTQALKNFLDGRTAIFDSDRNNFAPRFGFAWDPFASSKTQVGKTVVRGGLGVHYDIALGSVVSQSRNVFPTFIPFNIDANTFNYANNSFFNGQSGFFSIFNPIFVPVDVITASGGVNTVRRTPLVQTGQLNTIGAPANVLQPLLGLLLNPGQVTAQSQTLSPTGGGLAFTLPVKNLRSPYALHYNLQIERELFRDYLVNLAYVGSRGIKLTRFRTPNGGPNAITSPLDPLAIGGSGSNSTLPAIAQIPGNPNGRARSIPGLGSFTVFDSSASSNYNAMQVSVNKRFNQGSQMSMAYTWSHAIDDVSDVFDVAGAFSLPQDDRDLRAERASASFDIRHRLVTSMLSNVPLVSRFNDRKDALGHLLGGWQYAAFSTYQKGQPFTINTSFDLNLDGNLTDRLNRTNGLTVNGDGPTLLSLSAPRSSLVALRGTNGAVGRNTFRARGIWRNDLSIIKNIRVSESNSLIFRAEAFNLANRTHFGIPVRILEAPAFGQSVDTLIQARQVQFSLKYVF
ncbi:MAG: carboxypeptidase regulatory-like domain-containing protein [Blastocatellia bacterium]